MSANIKSDRIEIRLSSKDKRALQKGAKAKGVSVSVLCVDAGLAETDRILAEKSAKQNQQ